MPRPDVVLRGHITDVQAASYVNIGHGSSVLATGSLDGVIIIWDGNRPSNPLHKWVAHGGGVTALLRSSPGIFWSQGRDGWVYKWKVPVDTDAIGGLVLGAPILDLKLPAGFGSFCRMGLLNFASTNVSIVAAPSLHSENLEVWSVDDSDCRSNDPTRYGQSELTAVHVESAPGRVDPAKQARVRWLANFTVPSRKMGTDLGSSAALSPPTDLPYVADDDNYHYTKESEQHEADALGEAQFGALSRQQRALGMVTCVKLLDGAIALPYWVDERAGPRDSYHPVLLRTPVPVAQGEPTGDATEGGPVDHPLPQAGSLKEMLALRTALTGPAEQSPRAINALDTVRSNEEGPIGAKPTLRFLLAATYENGHFYVISDRPPLGARAASIVPTIGSAHSMASGLAALHAMDERESLDAALSDIGKATRGRVLIDVHLSNDPILTFALDPAYRRGLAGGAGGDIVLFSLDIPARTAQVTRRIALATPGISLATLIAKPPADVSEELHSHGPSLVATGGWDHTVRIIDLSAQEQVAQLEWHDASVYALAAMRVGAESEEADGNLGFDSTATGSATYRVATGAKDGRVAVWTIEVIEE